MNTRSLSRTPHQSRSIAVYMVDWSEWPRQVARGVQRFAHDLPGWRVYFTAGEAGREQILNQWARFDGIITASLRDAGIWRQVLRHGRTKVVNVSSIVPASLTGIPTVRVNDAKIAATIGRHLFTAGYRRLGFAFGPARGWRNLRAEQLHAFADSHRCPVHILKEPPVGQFKRSLRSLARTLSFLPKPLGVVAWNVSVGRLVVEACELANISVPAEIAVVSWDDDPIVAETVEPTLSAAVVPAERIGFEAARMLDRLLKGGTDQSASQLVDPAGLIHIRQSSDVGAFADRDVFLAVQYIREHAAEPLKVNGIAEFLNISRRSMERHFRRVTGKSVHDAIVAVRLEKAKQLLLETDWPTHRVAKESGFGTEQTLRLIFKKHEEMTPGLFRARLRGPSDAV